MCECALAKYRYTVERFLEGRRWTLNLMDYIMGLADTVNVPRTLTDGFRRQKKPDLLPASET